MRLILLRFLIILSAEHIYASDLNIQFGDYLVNIQSKEEKLTLDSKKSKLTIKKKRCNSVLLKSFFLGIQQNFKKLHRRSKINPYFYNLEVRFNDNVFYLDSRSKLANYFFGLENQFRVLKLQAIEECKKQKNL